MNLAIRLLVVGALAMAPAAHGAQMVLATAAWDVQLQASGGVPVCGATYRQNPGVYFSSQSLYIPVSTPIVTIIFGSNMALTEERPLSAGEQAAKHLILTAAELNRAQAAGRVVVMQNRGAITGGTITGVDLGDVKAMFAAVLQCQTALANQQKEQERAMQLAKTTIGLCAGSLVQRMFAAGISSGQISQACGAVVPPALIPGAGSVGGTSSAGPN